MVGIASELHKGLGVGLGMLIGGYVYAGLGPRLCFLPCAALPRITLLILGLPAVMRCSHVGGGNRRKGGMMDEEGLDGWGGAKSSDIAVPDFKPLRRRLTNKREDDGDNYSGQS